MLQADKERNEFKVMNDSIQTSVCVPHAHTYLVSSGVKLNVGCRSKSQRQKRKRLSNIVSPVIIVGLEG